MAKSKVSPFVGTWEFVSSENWDEFLREIGIGVIQRKLAASLKPTQVISNSGPDWCFRILTPMRTMEIRATEDCEFEDYTPDDKPCLNVLTKESENKLVQQQIDAATRELRVTIIREVIDNQLILTYTPGSGGPVCKRKFRKKM